MDAERVPRSHTRAEVFANSNIRLHGPVPMRSVLKAMFIYAFEDNAPLILKVPKRADSARKDVCVGSCEILDNKRRAHRRPLKYFNCGILMPIYCVSLDRVPVPISPQYAMQESK